MVVKHRGRSVFVSVGILVALFLGSVYSGDAYLAPTHAAALKSAADYDSKEAPSRSLPNKSEGSDSHLITTIVKIPKEVENLDETKPSTPDSPKGTNCSGTAVFDDQWSSGYKLVCQNNLYVLLVDLTNPAIRIDVAASNSLRSVESFRDSNTVAIINADYQFSPCSGNYCGNGLTIANGSSPTTFTNVSKLCQDGWVRREIGFSDAGRPHIDWWYKFVSDNQARSWCAPWRNGIPNNDSGGGAEGYSRNLVGAGPQFTFDGSFRWNCGTAGVGGNCGANGSDVVINDEHFGPSATNWWNRPQSAIGFSGDRAVLALAESNNASHTILAVHDAMNTRFGDLGKSLGNAFKLDGGSAAGFWYYKTQYASTSYVTVPSVIRVQRVNAPPATATPTPNPSSCSSSSSPGANEVLIYSGAGFSGNCRPLNVGSYSNSGTFNPVGDNDVESLKVGGNVRAWLYADQNYGGTNSLIESDDADLIDNGIGRNSTSSIVVEQKPPPASTNTPAPTNTPTPTSVGRPGNDDFANAVWLNGSSGSTSGSNNGATFESGEPYHFGIAASATTSVWYRWVPAYSSRVTIDTIGSSFDTVIGVYLGSTIGGLSLVAHDDDSGAYGGASRVSFDAIAGATYNVAVAGFYGATGNYVLNWQLSSAPTATPTPTPVNVPVGPSGYTYCVGEGGTCSFSGVKDVAYGANGRFNYLTGRTGSVACNNGAFGDPISGVYKACYTKDSTSSGGPAGYTYCVSEGSYCSFSGFKDVAYGANGQFRYFTGVSGGISCTNGAFGDPISGVAKACYTRDATSSGGPSGYTRCGGEGQQCSFSGPRDVAYGANGRFSYRYGLASTVSCANAYFGDPISGIAKACYISASSTGGPVGFAYCANENGTCSISSNQDVAYGANGSFAHRASLSSSVNCANSVFGDPISGIAKKCYSMTSNGGGPAGFGYCATEGGNCSFSGTKTVAYGANGKFFFWTGVSSSSGCSNSVFGDPISGVAKKCFIQ